MQVFETKALDELEIATANLTRALQKEARIIVFGGWAYVYKAVAITGMILLAAIFDSTLMRFLVPLSMLMLISIIDHLLNAMKIHVWKDRHAKEKIYFEKSKALSEYSSERLLQFLAVTALASTFNEDGGPETRVIN